MSGIISFNIRLLTISMIVSLVYGGMFWGIFPFKHEVSWESHLWGGISGFGLAFFFRKPVPAEPLEEEVEDYEEIDDNLPENAPESEEDPTR